MNINKARPATFFLVGVVNTLLDYILFSLITSYFLVGENKIGFAGLLSGTIALLMAYLTHSFITFRDRNNSKYAILKFLLFTGFGMWVIRPILLTLFIKISPLYDFAYAISANLHLPFSKDFISNTGAFGLMAILVLIYNYIVYSRFVFRDRVLS